MEESNLIPNLLKESEMAGPLLGLFCRWPNVLAYMGCKINFNQDNLKLPDQNLMKREEIEGGERLKISGLGSPLGVEGDDWF